MYFIAVWKPLRVISTDNSYSCFTEGITLQSEMRCGVYRKYMKQIYFRGEENKDSVGRCNFTANETGYVDYKNTNLYFTHSRRKFMLDKNLNVKKLEKTEARSFFPSTGSGK